MLSEGQVFAGDFRVVRLLSDAGGMGAVYVAEQLSTGKRRALKVLRPLLAAEEKNRLRFVEEARVGASIDSHHVVEVVGAGVDEASGMPWLAMELLDGRDLAEEIAVDGPMTTERARELLRQAQHALGRAHANGIIHRDLKPENIFVSHSNVVGEGTTVKILDFGIAKVLEGDKTAATVTSAIGSPMWLAPEQTATGAHLRPSTDVWALGLIAFYVLTGRRFWRSANLEAFNLHALMREVLFEDIPLASVRARELGAPPLPQGFDEWFARAVVREPADRFDNADQALSAFLSLGAPSAEAGSSAPHEEARSSAPHDGATLPLSGVSDAASPARSSSSKWALRVSALVLVLAAGGGIVLYLSVSERDGAEEVRTESALGETAAPEAGSVAAEPTTDLVDASRSQDAAPEPEDAGGPAIEEAPPRAPPPAPAPEPAGRVSIIAGRCDHLSQFEAPSRRRGLAIIRRCYSRALSSQPRLSGVAGIELDYDQESGQVTRVDCEEGAPALCGCADRGLRQMRLSAESRGRRGCVGLDFRPR